MVSVQEKIFRAGPRQVRFLPEGQSAGSRYVRLEEGEGRFSLAAYRDGVQTPLLPEELCAAGGLLWERGYRENPLALSCEGEGRLILCSTRENQVTAVTAEVGCATFLPREIPLRFETPLINDSVSVKGATLRMTAVGFTAPYAVVFLDTVGDCRCLALGGELSRLHIFPQGAEVVFAHVEEERRLRLQVFHRDGSRRPEGRDVCAALAAAVAVGRCAPDRSVSAPLEEGEFRAVCTKNRVVFLTCPVSAVSS